MEQAATYSMILAVSLAAGITRCYRRHRTMHRIQRGLRVYLTHTA